MLRKIALIALAVMPEIAAQDVAWKPSPVLAVTSTIPLNAAPIAVNASGNFYVPNQLVGANAPTGTIGNKSPSFAYVSAINSAGKSLYALQIYSSYAIEAISTDADGNVYIAGTAPASGFYITGQAYSSGSSGDGSAWVCKLNPSGKPVFCTYLNSNQLFIQSIATDSNGDVYILALNQAYPLAVPPAAVSLGTGNELLFKLSAAGSKLLWVAGLTAVALGGEPLTVDAAGDAYVPVTGPGGQNAVGIVNPSGTAISYLPLDAGAEVWAIALDGSGGVYVAGATAAFNTFISRYANGARVYEDTLSHDGLLVFSPLAVDTSGVATVVENYPGPDFPEHLSTGQCTASGGAVMVRVSAMGDVLQSTYLGSDLYPIALLTNTSGGYVAGAVNAPHLLLLRIAPDPTGSAVSTIGCVANSADLTSGAVTPGEIVTVFGEGLGPLAAAAAPLTSQVGPLLGGAEITFNGKPAPLMYAQDSQMNAIVPWEIGGESSTQMCATYQEANHCITLPLAAVSPGLFTSPPGYAVAVDQDGTLNSSSNPAQEGQNITLYATGLGPMTPAPADGAIVQPPLPDLTDSVQVVFGYGGGMNGPGPQQGKVISAGPAPFSVAGLYAICVQVPVTAGFAGVPDTVWLQVFLPGGASVESPVANVFVSP